MSLGHASCLHRIAIISGGTATNALVNVFDKLPKVDQIAFILPISDNGGSSAEILRVFGGPAIGDLRSRITKLTCLKDNGNSRLGLFFSFRLSIEEPEATDQWKHILFNIHEVCELIPDKATRYYILFILINLNRIIHEEKHGDFNFQNASIGNLFMLGLRLLYGFDVSECAQFFVRFVGINDKYLVIPSISSKDKRYNIAALLNDGNIIKGQSQISHPAAKPVVNKLTTPSDLDLSALKLNEPQLIFQKEHTEPLPSPIRKIIYTTDTYEEYQPDLFQGARDVIKRSDVVIYSIGSLMTSIMPVLIQKGTGEAIMDGPIKKVLLLNGNHDRETDGFDGFEFVTMIVNSLLYSLNLKNQFNVPLNEKLPETFDKIQMAMSPIKSFIQFVELQRDFFKQFDYEFRLTNFITHIFYLEYGEIAMYAEAMEQLGIKCVAVNAMIRRKNVDVYYRYELGDFGKKLARVLRE